MANISSIDDLLMGVGNSQQPATPEHKEKVKEQEDPVNDEVNDAPDYNDEENEPADVVDDNIEPDEPDSDEETPEEKPKAKVDDETDDDGLDEYGNEKERMPKGVKDRLDRKDRQHQQEVAQRDRQIETLLAQLAQQGASKDVQQAAKDFKYDPNDDSSWQQQLSEFVKQTVNSMTSETQQKEREMQEQHAEREFHQRFTKGMERFGDFVQTVGAQPIDDAMTMALRGMADPSAFIYAASKRQPGELERIAKLKDPYAKMVEMGKLEERMRRNKPTTKTPRPLGRSKEDAAAKTVVKQKDMSGDDLLAKADQKRLAKVSARHKANR